MPNDADKPAIDLKDYRQPMVTSIGIMLGFLVGFLGNWVTESSFSLAGTDDRIIFFGCLAGSVCLFVALFRMLNIVPPGNVARYYRRTLYIFISGAALAFLSILLSVFF